MEEFIKKNTSMIFIILGIIVFLLVLSTFVLFMGQKKIVFVDNAVIMDNYKGTIDARDKMKEGLSGVQEKVDGLKKDIDDSRNKLIEQSDKLSSSEIVKLKKDIEQKQKQYDEYVTAINNQISAAEQQAMAPIINEINEKIKKFGESNGYDIILGATTSGNIVYAKKILNISADVVKYLNNEYDKKIKKEKTSTDNTKK